MRSIDGMSSESFGYLPGVRSLSSSTFQIPKEPEASLIVPKSLLTCILLVYTSRNSNE
jgi:hypothetical protein